MISKLSASTRCAEAAADERLDHADARLVHLQAARQHQVQVVGHLRDRCCMVRRSAHGSYSASAACSSICAWLTSAQSMLTSRTRSAAAKPARRRRRCGAPGVRGCPACRRATRVASGARAACARVIAGQFAHFELDQVERALRGRRIDRSDGRDRLAAIAHLVARQRILVLRDRQHAVGVLAVFAGDDCDHARRARAPSTRRGAGSRRG